MKKITLLVTCLMGLTAIMQAQETKLSSDATDLSVKATTTTIKYERLPGTDNFNEFLSTGNTQTINLSEKGISSVISQQKTLAITTYTDRTAFETDASGTLANEDFSGGPGAGQILACGPIMGSGGDSCFPAGTLEEGFNITASSGGDIIYIGAGAIGNTSTIVGANTFADFTLLNFSPDGAYSVGVDLFIDTVPDVEVRVYDMGGVLLDTFTVTNTPNTENFFGIISDEAIGHIEYEADADAGELFGNLIFGTEAGGGTGGDCDLIAASNALENGKSITKSLGRIVANDLKVADNETMLLESITFTALMGTAGSGVNADEVDVYIYEDDGAGAPGALWGTPQLSLTPDSQVVVGSNFGYDAWSIVLDIADVNLPGQVGSDTTYWIGLSLEATDGTNVFWEYSTASVIGYGLSYNDNGAGFVTEPDNEGVYTFSGDCSPLGMEDNVLIGFSYYPNPTSDVLSLKSVNTIDSVSVFNLLGQKVLDSKVGATSSELNLSALNTGTYIMKVSVNGQIGTYRVLKN